MVVVLVGGNKGRSIFKKFLDPNTFISFIYHAAICLLQTSYDPNQIQQQTTHV
jgi:hypothetical protein